MIDKNVIDCFYRTSVKYGSWTKPDVNHIMIISDVAEDLDDNEQNYKIKLNVEHLLDLNSHDVVKQFLIKCGIINDVIFDIHWSETFNKFCEDLVDNINFILLKCVVRNFKKAKTTVETDVYDKYQSLTTIFNIDDTQSVCCENDNITTAIKQPVYPNKKVIDDKTYFDGIFILLKKYTEWHENIILDDDINTIDKLVCDSRFRRLFGSQFMACSLKKFIDYVISSNGYQGYIIKTDNNINNYFVMSIDPLIDIAKLQN